MTTTKITAPGLYYGVDHADYFADQCPTPSLTQSIAKILVAQSPRHAWIAHPKLNPKWEQVEEKKYDVGNIAHSLLLGRGKKLVVIQGDDWVADRKEKTRLREEAANQGKIGVLSRDYDLAVAMVNAAWHQLDDRGYRSDFFVDVDKTQPGDGEVVAAALVDGIWMRALVDWLLRNKRRVYDLKTTSRSAAPHALELMPEDMNWDLQAAMHERLLDVLDPDNAGRREHLFIVQENYEPFALTVVKLTEASLTMGRKKLAHAERIWAECLRSDHWPLYPLETLQAGPTEWGERRWLAREAAEDGDGRGDQHAGHGQNILSAG